jgi:DNA-binding transcriptional MerR regulator
VSTLYASQAARRLGISPKALRLYERSGLVTPSRTEAGWRVYGPDEMRRAAEIAGLRALGFSLAQVRRVLEGGLEDALAEHQAALEGRVRALAATVDKVRSLRAPEPGSGSGSGPSSGMEFDLPWPWDGERFALGRITALTYITGPLGSGKTRLAQRIAEVLPGAVFMGLDRPPGPAELEAGLEARGPSAFVVDMIEQGLDEEAQRALIARLRRRGPGARPIFALTRSTAILDLKAGIGADETILFCPANHGMPIRVAPHPGAQGYEALTSCLASPAVRARTAGVVAVRAG